jgi:hypothetical protein
LESDAFYESSVRVALEQNDLFYANQQCHQWLKHYSQIVSSGCSRDQFRHPELWLAIANVAERTSDFLLVEKLFQIFEHFTFNFSYTGRVPLLGVPIVNRPDLLARLLDSLDVPVDVLAIVDNSRISGHDKGSTVDNSVQRYLSALQQIGHPLVDTILVSVPFRHLGVAASWNHILTSFPELPLALIVNNDVVFAANTLRQSLERINLNRPQFLPLFQAPNSFSAFFMTSLCWDQLGLFDPNFQYAYFEDMEYRDRLISNPAVEWIQDVAITAAMDALNHEHSLTIKSNPAYAASNQLSYAMNKLWYLSPRRFRGEQKGLWRRLWLAQWD